MRTTTKPSTLPRPQTGTIEWPGSEPLTVPRQQAIDTLRACAFLREPVIVTTNGKRTNQRDIAVPSGLSETQAIIAQEQLLHRIHFKLQDILPKGTSIEFIGPDQAPWDDGYMMEIGDGWTLGPTIEINRGYRSAIKWHAYDPEGEPIAESTTETQAVAALVASIYAYTITNNWNTEP